MLVKHFALGAKQNGIPELKTILGGFVMREILGPWVLIVKSLGLVCLKFTLDANSTKLPVSCSCLRSMGGQRRALGPCSELLRKPSHEIVPHTQRE